MASIGDRDISHRLLAVASRPSEFFEMAQLARGLARSSHVTLLYLHAASEPALHADIVERIRHERSTDGIEMIAVDFDRVREGEPRSRWSLLMDLATPGFAAEVAGIIRQVPVALWPGVAMTARRAFLTTRLFQRCIDFYSSLIRERRITAVLLPEDIVGPFWPVAVKAAHQNSIPAIVFPYTLADRNEALQSLKHDPRSQTAANRIGAALFPAWRWRGPDFDLVRLPEDQIFAHQRLDIAPPDPWMMNSGFADAICVDSEASCDFFAAGGIPRRRMSVVGSASQDEMFTRLRDRDARRAALYARFDFAAAKPLLLVSGCPNQLAATVPHCEFASMEELARAVGAALAPLSTSFNLLVRPHPNYAAFGEMLQPAGFRVASEATAELVPLSDVFVAFASATIRWAIGCGVPTINYDVFNYGYSEFANVSGVESVNTHAAFLAQCAQLTSAGRVAELRRQIQTQSGRWAVMDGESVNRIYRKIAEASTKA